MSSNGNGNIESERHPFGALNRHATRNEVVNAATAIGEKVYNQIADEHNKAMTELYEEFSQFREVAARRIREIERGSWSFIVQRAIRTDVHRAKKWLAMQLDLLRGWLLLHTGHSELETLALASRRVNSEVPDAVLTEVELLARQQAAADTSNAS